MKRLALLSIPMFVSTAAFAADLDGPKYSEREVEIEREAPPRVVEYHHYYHRAPEYAERVYEEPRYYDEPRYYAYDRPYFAYSAWRPRHRFWHHGGRHHHYRRW
jgi:hypothetical protein